MPNRPWDCSAAYLFAMYRYERWKWRAEGPPVVDREQEKARDDSGRVRAQRSPARASRIEPKHQDCNCSLVLDDQR